MLSQNVLSCVDCCIEINAFLLGRYSSPFGDPINSLASGMIAAMLLWFFMLPK